MPKLKPFSPKELIKILEELGFEFAGQKGSHAKYKKALQRVVKTIKTFKYCITLFVYTCRRFWFLSGLKKKLWMT